MKDSVNIGSQPVDGQMGFDFPGRLAGTVYLLTVQIYGHQVVHGALTKRMAAAFDDNLIRAGHTGAEIAPVSGLESDSVSSPGAG